jgi:hypothetical protein
MTKQAKDDSAATDKPAFATEQQRMIDISLGELPRSSRKRSREVGDQTFDSFVIVNPKRLS